MVVATLLVTFAVRNGRDFPDELVAQPAAQQ
jgi:hypothetical protein